MVLHRKSYMLKTLQKTFITLAFGAVLFSIPTPKLNALEPVSLAMMAAPVVKPMIEAMIPYVVTGGVNFFNAFIDVFLEMTGIFLLPFGMLESTLGAPLGLFKDGISNMAKGCIAPLKTGWSMMRMPVRIFTG